MASFNKQARWGTPVATPYPRSLPADSLRKSLLASAAANVAMLQKFDAVAVALNNANSTAALAQINQQLASNNQWLQQMCASLDTIGTKIGPAPAQEPGDISEAAWLVCACLVQVRNALCDRQQATPESVNGLLKKAGQTKAADASRAMLRASGQEELIAGFEEQFEALDGSLDFDQQRRLRLYELNEYEIAVLLRLRDQSVA